ncbi:YfiT family bacillithiol transferase [Flavobacterium eburneipallidum]|uniref:YfiT family bacillithiol transferase n=1 Tax=Flavobacterium eburneipallidum TaxID=3003263 RepID=UPI0022ABD780|nr:putative metal-dependent hydrolase [Flavobacterium eburneipallidum]
MENTFNLEKLKFPIGQFQKPETISQNDLDSWINDIESFPSRIKNLTSSLTVEELNWIYRPQGWNIKQVVHHCADSHINSLIRFKLALTEELPTIKPYEEQLWAELADGNSNDISPSLQLIEGLHKRWVLLLKSFSSTELKRLFIHPSNKKTSTLEETIGMYAWHGNHHLAHIEQALAHKGQF